ncbi:MAG: dual specificity protein phosphatase family protein [Candidatus Yanofskybacteria bacterium]|nr:dual specificity protein phosphatase family protein [Candidatus Yanofskybacteria bacterium]
MELSDLEKQLSEHDIQTHERDHHFSADKSFDYDQITDEIFIGTNMCCIVGYARELIQKNVLGDISLEKNRIDNPIGIDYFLWLPVEDHQAPTPNQLELGVEVMDFFVKNKMKFYIHCKNGHGRAPTLVAAYFMKQGKSANEALNLIKSKRPSIHLEDIQKKALEKFLKNK